MCPIKLNINIGNNIGELEWWWYLLNFNFYLKLYQHLVFHLIHLASAVLLHPYFFFLSSYSLCFTSQQFQLFLQPDTPYNFHRNERSFQQLQDDGVSELCLQATRTTATTVVAKYKKYGIIKENYLLLKCVEEILLYPCSWINNKKKRKLCLASIHKPFHSFTHQTLRIKVILVSDEIS